MIAEICIKSSHLAHVYGPPRGILASEKVKQEMLALIVFVQSIVCKITQEALDGFGSNFRSVDYLHM